MTPKYLRPGFDFALHHAIEEAGEFLAAAGKTLRWGRDSVNPELPVVDRETNEQWLVREMGDLRGALDRLEHAIRDSDGSPKGGDACGSAHDSASIAPPSIAKTSGAEG